MISSILSAYGISDEKSQVVPLTDGLINRTWKVTRGSEQFILQRINDHVFKQPYQLAANIEMLNNYLAEKKPDYLFVAPVKNLRGDTIVFDKQHGYFRLFAFVRGSHTINVVSTPEQAFEAAAQFGQFTRYLSGFDASHLHITIPDFHNLTLRYRQFEEAIATGNPDRIKQSKDLIADIKKRTHILDSFEKIKTNNFVRRRVIHHDTKISNVLFDDQGKGICVIDLDTVMPGYFISDVGDMMRTYLSPANEEEKDFSKVHIRRNVFQAVVDGYLSYMADELTSEEKELLIYSGLFLIYMQAIRFLADHINNDLYYGAAYEGHNLIRAGNQISLLKRLEESSEVLSLDIAG